MQPTEKQEIVDEFVEFINTWRSSHGLSESGELVEPYLSQFVLELQNKIISKLSFDGSANQTLILYSGKSSDNTFNYKNVGELCALNPLPFFRR